MSKRLAASVCQEFFYQTLLLTSVTDSDGVCRPIFGSLGLEGVRSRLGLGLECFRSRDFEYCKEVVY